MRICFDLDNTLCIGKPYLVAAPIPGAVELLAQLKLDGHTIILYTARGMGRTDGAIGPALKQVGQITFAQLETWGFQYDEIYFGKPAADIYFDDKSLSIKTYKEVEQHIERLNMLITCTSD